MTRIAWDEVGVRRFETGIDRGVFYPSSGDGVPWNGLISVDLKQDGVSSSPVYFDDKKINDIIYLGDLSASVRALTYPDEFLPYDGFVECADGLFIDGQDRGVFDLAYRSLIGDDVDGLNLGYKIHLLYNLTAIPEDVTNQSIDSNIAPIEFGWTFTSVPGEIPGFRPSSHIVVDSTKVDPDVLATIEDILYGTESDSPRMPSMLEVYSAIALTIIDNGDGTWTARGPDTLVNSLSTDDFELDTPRVTSISAWVYEAT